MTIKLLAKFLVGLLFAIFSIIFISNLFSNYISVESKCDNSQVIKNQNPGLSNICHKKENYFKTISTITSPFGHGVATMVNEYLMTVYSSDGGGSYLDGGIEFWDLSDAYSPKLVSQYDNDKTKELREAHSFGLSKIKNKNYAAFQSITGFQIWNITDPLNIEFISSLNIPGIMGGNYTGIWWLSWQHPYLYLGGTSNGLYTIDTSKISDPKMISRISTSDLGGLNPSVVYAAGNLLVGMEALSGQLFTMDISIPDNPKLIDTFTGAPGYAGIFTGKEFITSGGDIAIGGNGETAGMHRYGISKEGLFSYLGWAGDNLEDGGYGSYQDGYFISGFSDSFAKFNVLSNNQIKRGQVLNKKADQDFAIFLGNLAFISDDHGEGSSIIVHDTQIDNNPPVVEWTSPYDGEKNVSLSSRIGISFSDQISLKSLTNKNIILKDNLGNIVEGTFSLQGNLVNFSPEIDLRANTKYYLTISNIEDVVGNKSKFINQSFITSDKEFNQISECKIIDRSPSAVDENITLKASETVSSKGTKYFWKFDESGYVLETNIKEVKHAYKKPGRYSISLESKDSNGKKVICSSVHVVYDQILDNKSTHSSPIIEAFGNIYSVNSDNNTVTWIDGGFPGNNYKCEISVGNTPKTIASNINASDKVNGNKNLWVTNERSDTITIIHPTACKNIRKISLQKGSLPYGVIFDTDGIYAYVTLQGTGEVLKISPDGEIIDKIKLSQNIRDLSISPDSKTIYVSKFISDHHQGTIYKINVDTFKLQEEIKIATDFSLDTAVSGRGVPNYIGPVVISPNGKIAMVPSKKDNIFRGENIDGNDLNFENTVRSIVSVIDLESSKELTNKRNDLNDRSLPRDIVFSKYGDIYFVVSQGSNQVDVFESNTNKFVTSFYVGDAPEAAIIDSTGTKFYVKNSLSRDIYIYDILDIVTGISNSVDLVKTISTVKNEIMTAEVLRGKKIFYNASDTRMAQDGYISCATCHIEGTHDGQVYNFKNKGLRNTMSLLGLNNLEDYKLNWSGDLDEIQDFENEIRDFFGGSGFMSDSNFSMYSNIAGKRKEGINQDLDDLASYVMSLADPYRSPFRGEDGLLSESAKKGRILFKNKGCASCHSGKYFTDAKLYNLSDLSQHHKIKNNGDDITRVKTPSLMGIWSTSPYLHDGSANTLIDTLNIPNIDNQNDLNDLINFIKSIDQYEPEIR